MEGEGIPHEEGNTKSEGVGAGDIKQSGRSTMCVCRRKGSRAWFL